MTVDPGYPFSKSLAQIITDLEDRIREGTEQPAEETFVYRGGGALTLSRQAFAVCGFTPPSTSIIVSSPRASIIWRNASILRSWPLRKL